MLVEKESQSLIKQLINDEKIIKPESGRAQYFLSKSIESLDVARRIYALSTDKNDTLKSFMWVITTSYYSMFFAATALLTHYTKKINVDAGIHKATYHALVYYFHVLDKKLQKHFIEAYKDSYENAEELLQTSEKKALELLEGFKHEQDKRKIFTYEMGKVAEEHKARLSLQRAENFYEEVRMIIQSKEIKKVIP